MGVRRLRARRLLVTGILFAVATNLLACTDAKQEIVGRWTSQQTSFLTLQFYQDGTASLSSTGLLSLRWQLENDKLVRIEALDKKMYFNFRIQKDDRGSYGVLELAGFDTLLFRKI